MADFQNIHDAHGELVSAVRDVAQPGFDPIPISVVSVKAEEQSQLVIFDGNKYGASEVARRLRLAADLIESQTA